MTLRKTIEEVKKWTIKEQVEFCNRIIFNITIGIRSILSHDDKSDADKLEAITSLNEFHHRIFNLKFGIENKIGDSDKIEKIGKTAKLYASRNKQAAGEIAEIIRHSYKCVTLSIRTF